VTAAQEVTALEAHIGTLAAQSVRWQHTANALAVAAATVGYSATASQFAALQGYARGCRNCVR
jgi:hypothetical protein